jgi:signal transduction histidine kinase
MPYLRDLDQLACKEGHAEDDRGVDIVLQAAVFQDASLLKMIGGEVGDLLWRARAFERERRLGEHRPAAGDLSKIEAGKLELNPQTVQLAPLINDVISTAGQLAEQNKNRLVVDAQENLGALTVDSIARWSQRSFRFVAPILQRADTHHQGRGSSMFLFVV